MIVVDLLMFTCVYEWQLGRITLTGVIAVENSAMYTTSNRDNGIVTLPGIAHPAAENAFAVVGLRLTATSSPGG